MVKLTRSLEAWLLKFHPDIIWQITFEHVELLTEEMWDAYIDWLRTPEGRSYLDGGEK